MTDIADVAELGAITCNGQIIAAIAYALNRNARKLSDVIGDKPAAVLVS